MIKKTPPVTVPPAGGPGYQSVALLPIASPPVAPKPKRVVKRLKWRTRPVHTAYMQNGQILDMDSDVTFHCADGGVVKGHKVILALSSKMFTDMFMGQGPQEMSVVSVPDVRSDVMKLLLLMTYKEAVVVTAEQMERLKEAAALFCMNWDRFKREPTATDVCVDVRPGKIMDSPKKLPPPLMARPEQFFGVHKRLGPSMMNNRTQGQHPNDMRFGGKPQTAEMHQNFPSRALQSMQQCDGEEEEESEGSNFQIQGCEPEPSTIHNLKRRNPFTPRRDPLPHKASTSKSSLGSGLPTDYVAGDDSSASSGYSNENRKKKAKKSGGFLGRSNRKRKAAKKTSVAPSDLAPVLLANEPAGQEGQLKFPLLRDENMKFIDTDTDDNDDDYCAVCRVGGEDITIYCDKCSKAFHLKCHVPAVDEEVPPDDWQCNRCKSQEEACKLLIDLCLH